MRRVDSVAPFSHRTAPTPRDSAHSADPDTNRVCGAGDNLARSGRIPRMKTALPNVFYVRDGILA
jgi:hypothetical protein